MTYAQLYEDIGKQQQQVSQSQKSLIQRQEEFSTAQRGLMTAKEQLESKRLTASPEEQMYISQEITKIGKAGKELETGDTELSKFGVSLTGAEKELGEQFKKAKEYEKGGYKLERKDGKIQFVKKTQIKKLVSSGVPEVTQRVHYEKFVEGEGWVSDGSILVKNTMIPGITAEVNRDPYYRISKIESLGSGRVAKKYSITYDIKTEKISGLDTTKSFDVDNSFMSGGLFKNIQKIMPVELGEKDELYPYFKEVYRQDVGLGGSESWLKKYYHRIKSYDLADYEGSASAYTKALGELSILEKAKHRLVEEQYETALSDIKPGGFYSYAGGEYSGTKLKGILESEREEKLSFLSSNIKDLGLSKQDIMSTTARMHEDEPATRYINIKDSRLEPVVDTEWWYNKETTRQKSKARNIFDVKLGGVSLNPFDPVIYQAKTLGASTMRAFDPNFWVDIAPQAIGGRGESVGKSMGDWEYGMRKTYGVGAKDTKFKEFYLGEGLLQSPAYKYVVYPGLIATGAGAGLGLIGSAGAGASGVTGATLVGFSKVAPYALIATGSTIVGADVGKTIAYEQHGMIPKGASLEKSLGYGVMFASAGAGGKAGYKWGAGKHPYLARVETAFSNSWNKAVGWGQKTPVGGMGFRGRVNRFLDEGAMNKYYRGATKDYPFKGSDPTPVRTRFYGKIRSTRFKLQPVGSKIKAFAREPGWELLDKRLTSTELSSQPQIYGRGQVGREGLTSREQLFARGWQSGESRLPPEKWGAYETSWDYYNAGMGFKPSYLTEKFPVRQRQVKTDFSKGKKIAFIDKTGKVDFVSKEFGMKPVGSDGKIMDIGQKPIKVVDVGVRPSRYPAFESKSSFEGFRGSDWGEVHEMWAVSPPIGSKHAILKFDKLASDISLSDSGTGESITKLSGITKTVKHSGSESGNIKQYDWYQKPWTEYTGVKQYGRIGSVLEVPPVHKRWGHMFHQPRYEETRISSIPVSGELSKQVLGKATGSLSITSIGEIDKQDMFMGNISLLDTKSELDTKSGLDTDVESLMKQDNKLAQANILGLQTVQAMDMDTMQLQRLKTKLVQKQKLRLALKYRTPHPPIHPVPPAITDDTLYKSEILPPIITPPVPLVSDPEGKKRTRQQKKVKTKKPHIMESGEKDKGLLSDLLSVTVSHARHGTATHPKLTKKVWKEGKKSLYMHVPTKELTKAKKKKKNKKKPKLMRRQKNVFI